jgi:RNA polymerase sigma-70 factor (ECF subfamily)
VFRRGKDRAAVPEDGADRSAVEAARHDPQAFEILYRKYVAQVYNFALYELRDRHAAEDLTEQVFLRALAGLPRFEEHAPPPASSFRVWLFQIARNALANERRHTRRHPLATLDEVLELPAADDPPGMAAAREEVTHALAAIAALPADRRRAIVLRFVDELSTREIGQVLGRSEAATRVLIHRALRSVAAQLDARHGRPERRPGRRETATH